MAQPREDDVLERLGIDAPDAPDADDVKRLVRYLIDLGATDEEIVAAAPVGGLGPLALDLAMRPEGPSPTLEQFVDEPDVDADATRRTWQAFGLPQSSRFPVPVTPDAADALRAMAFLRGVVGEDAVLAFARVLGSSAARIADSLAAMMRVGVEVPQRDTGIPYSEVVEGYSTIARDLLPTLWDGIGAVFRRHLVLLSYQLWSTDEAGTAVTVERTVGFADLVGSTDVLRTLSVARMAELVDQFEQLVWGVVTSAGGRVVKLIGDEAMFVMDDTRAACHAGRNLIERSPHPLRVGLAHGTIAALHGDYYGPTVNLAARLVSAAAPATVLVSEEVRDAVSDEFMADRVDTGPLRGFPSTTAAYSLRARDSR